MNNRNNFREFHPMEQDQPHAFKYIVIGFVIGTLLLAVLLVFSNMAMADVVITVMPQRHTIPCSEFANPTHSPNIICFTNPMPEFQVWSDFPSRGGRYLGPMGNYTPSGIPALPPGIVRSVELPPKPTQPPDRLAHYVWRNGNWIPGNPGWCLPHGATGGCSDAVWQTVPPKPRVVPKYDCYQGKCFPHWKED